MAQYKAQYKLINDTVVLRAGEGLPLKEQDIRSWVKRRLPAELAGVMRIVVVLPPERADHATYDGDVPIYLVGSHQEEWKIAQRWRVQYARMPLEQRRKTYTLALALDPYRGLWATYAPFENWEASGESLMGVVAARLVAQGAAEGGLDLPNIERHSGPIPHIELPAPGGCRYVYSVNGRGHLRFIVEGPESLPTVYADVRVESPRRVVVTVLEPKRLRPRHLEALFLALWLLDVPREAQEPILRVCREEDPGQEWANAHV